MSREIYLSSLVAEPPSAPTRFYYHSYLIDHDFITRRPAAKFAPKVKDEEDIGEQSKKRTYEVCVQVEKMLVAGEHEGKYQRKRRLVSLYEANEVAKRLAGVKRDSSHVVSNGRVLEDAKPDVVSEWMADF